MLRRKRSMTAPSPMMHGELIIRSAPGVWFTRCSFVPNQLTELYPYRSVIASANWHDPNSIRMSTSVEIQTLFANCWISGVPEIGPWSFSMHF
jgi:hypothetical protein